MDRSGYDGKPDTERWSYVLLPAVGLHDQRDAWAEVRAIVDREGADDAYWSLRAFSLDARFELALEPPNLLRWAGPLMDLACSLYEWVHGEGPDLLFSPLEQAPSLTIRARGAIVDFYVGGQFAGNLSQRDARSSVEGFLTAFAKDVRREVPKAVDVRGLEWLSV